MSVNSRLLNTETGKAKKDCRSFRLIAPRVVVELRLSSGNDDDLFVVEPYGPASRAEPFGRILTSMSVVSALP